VNDCFVREEIDTVEGRNGKASTSPFLTDKLTVKSLGIIPDTPTVNAFEASSPLEKDVVTKFTCNNRQQLVETTTFVDNICEYDNGTNNEE
jgi:hypothetical protein